MVITDGFVVCQANADYTSPIAQFSTLQDAADWLIGIYTLEGGGLMPQYNPELYVVEQWAGGVPTTSYWQVEPDGSTTPL